MAYTKVLAIRARLDKKVAYAANEEKTALDRAVDYAENPAKTEQLLFTTALNCQSPVSAYAEMMKTKQKWGKADKVLGYHFIQSFSPGEVTPEQAHTIGVEFARRCFGDSFEVVIGTHLDRDHLHSHIVVNSVSFVDGHKYHSSPESYYNNIRGVSDELCRENGLSVIEPAGHGRHYAEWKAEQEGKTTVRDIIRADIDAAILASFTLKSFWDELRRRGYRLRLDRKHKAVSPPGRAFFRIDGLGPDYTEEAIQARIERQRRTGRYQPPVTPSPHRRYRYRGKFTGAKKLHGFKALYYHYLYLLGKVKKRRASPRVRKRLSADLICFDRYMAQYRYLSEKRIDTIRDLEQYQDAVEIQIKALTDSRQGLYAERRDCTNEREKAALSEKIARCTDALRAYRKERRMCERIAADAARLRERLQQAERKPPAAQYRTQERKVGKERHFNE